MAKSFNQIDNAEDLTFLVYCYSCHGHTQGKKVCPVCGQAKETEAPKKKYRRELPWAPSIFEKGICFSGRQLKAYVSGGWKIMSIWQSAEHYTILYPAMCHLHEKDEEISARNSSALAWNDYLRTMDYLGKYLANIEECDPLWFAVDVISGEVIDTTNYGLFNDVITLEESRACEPEFWTERIGKIGT